LWRYRLSDSTWTWIGGSDSPNQPGVYGEKGNANTFFVPSARKGAAGWFDSSKREFWLFGGIGYGNVGAGEGMQLNWFTSQCQNLIPVC